MKKKPPPTPTFPFLKVVQVEANSNGCNRETSPLLLAILIWWPLTTTGPSFWTVFRGEYTYSGGGGCSRQRPMNTCCACTDLRCSCNLGDVSVGFPKQWRGTARFEKSLFFSPLISWGICEIPSLLFSERYRSEFNPPRIYAVTHHMLCFFLSFI